MATKTPDEILDIQKALTSYFNSALLPEDFKKQALISSCLAFLISNGFVINKIITLDKNVINIKSLITYFYNKLKLTTGCYPIADIKKDTTIAKMLVARLKDDLGLAPKQAITFAVELIDVLFDNLSDFNFTNQIYTSFSVLGQDGMRWVTDKALSIINQPCYSESKLLISADKAAKDYLEANNIELGYEEVNENNG